MSELPDVAEVRRQLERILARPGFSAAARLCSFLRFVVEEELAGRGAEIKEYVIGVNVYGKGEDYDPRTDPSVRVDAGKIRARLSEYYGALGLDDPIVISMPKGTYVPTFELRPAAVVTAAPAKPRRLSHLAIAIAAGLVILVIVVSVLLPGRLGRSSALPAPVTRLVTISSELGEPSDPSLSPDGSMVAFRWNREAPESFHIYLKVVNAPDALQLTSGQGNDAMPAWSPDGRQIAFMRNPGPAGEVYVVSALGGQERRVTDSSGESLGWTADSQSVLVMDRKSVAEPFAGYAVSIESGERRQLTDPPAGSYTGDYDLVAAPNGRSIAFCRMVHPPVAELWLVPAAGGRAEKIAESRKYIRGLAWTPDSRTIIYSSEQSGFSALWSLKIAPRSPPFLLPGVETDAVRPSIPVWPGRLDRIAYQRREQPYRLWRATISGGRMSAAWCVIASQRNDWFPQISPDSQWMTFTSDRAGRFDIWVSRLDGSELKNLTTDSPIVSGSPRWSPDGSAIVFDAHGPDENSAIYTIAASGGVLRRVTSDKSESVRPSWSANGKWIYYTSDRTGRREIWKAPAGGGAAVQVSRGGGFEPFESVDGRDLYFLDHPQSTKLWRMPSEGGVASLVLDGVREGRWGVTAGGIYFIDSSRQICQIDLAGKVACVGAVDRQSSMPAGMSLSRDGKEIVYVQPEPVRSTLMMAEGSLFH